MKKTVLLLFLMIMVLALSSCLSVIGNISGLNAKTPKVDRIEVPGKDVYFIGMSHLATKEFYENTKKIIADFQKKGYVFYLESTRGVGAATIPGDTLYFKKFRKLTTLNLTKSYSQFDEPIFQKLIDEYDLLDQPSYDSLGISNYKWVDYYYTELIDFYEKRHATVTLDECDIKTPLTDNYNCPVDKVKRKQFTREIIFTERNKKIAATVLQSGDQKIVIVYGKKHLDGIKLELSNLLTGKK